MLNSKNKILLFLLFIVTITKSIAQDSNGELKFNVPNPTIEVAIEESKESDNFIVSIQVVDTIKENAHFRIILGNATSTPSSEFRILTPTLFIPKNTLPKKEFEVVLEIPTRKEEKVPSLIELEISPIDNGAKKVKFNPINRQILIVKNGKRTSIYDNKQSFKAEDFRIDLGTNFDFLDGVKAGGLYANVFTFAPNLITKNVQKNKRGTPFGLGVISGIRQNRLIGDTLKSSRSEFSYNLVAQNLEDSLNTYLRTTINRTSKTIVNSTSLYFNPIFTLKENDKVGIYFGPNIEVIRQVYSTKSNFSLTDTTTITRPFSTRFRSFQPIEELKRTFHNFSFGFKMPVFFRVKKININIVPSFGYSKRSSSAESYNEGYYGVYFNAIELESGINLGGEINVFISKPEGGEDFSIRSPIIGIYLSKAFNLNPLGKYKGRINP